MQTMTDPDPATVETTKPTWQRAAMVATISIKLPPVWPSDQEIWFAQVEATFNLTYNLSKDSF